MDADIVRSQSSIASEESYIDKAVLGGKIALGGRVMIVQSKHVPQCPGLLHDE